MRFLLALGLSGALLFGCGGPGVAGGSGGSGVAGGSGGSGVGGGSGGSGVGGGLGGTECPCEADGSESFTTSLDCFCRQYICEPGSDEFSGDRLVVEEYPDCDRRVLNYLTGEPPETSLVVDTTTGQVVGARYLDDSGVCSDAGVSVSAGEFPTCELSRTCEGPCDDTGL